MTDIKFGIAPSRGSLDSEPDRIFLCSVIDAEVGIRFRDLIVRCLARGEGSPEILDIIFSATDFLILRAAMQDLHVAPSRTAVSENCSLRGCEYGCSGPVCPRGLART